MRYIDSAEGWIAEIVSWLTSPAAVMEGSAKQKANGELIVAAWNACVEINPKNPQAAAEAMPAVFAAVKDLLEQNNRHLYLPAGMERRLCAAFDKAIAKE